MITIALNLVFYKQFNLVVSARKVKRTEIKTTITTTTTIISGMAASTSSSSSSKPLPPSSLAAAISTRNQINLSHGQ